MSISCESRSTRTLQNCAERRDASARTSLAREQNAGRDLNSPEVGLDDRVTEICSDHISAGCAHHRDGDA